MAHRIGILLPRSTDYPAMGFNIFDGLRCSMKHSGKNDIEFITENIGFGEDHALNYSKAEKLFMQDDVSFIIAYCNPKNAEPLYPLAEAIQKPLLFLDGGVQHPDQMKHPLAFHISLQGLEASYHAGELAGEGGRKVLKATSFYEGGYRSPWAAVQGVEAKGGSICGNYVSAHRIADFEINKYMQLLEVSQPQSVFATFSIYLAELFFKSLKEAGDKATALPFYCSSFMAEEQLLNKWDFPGGKFRAVVPWASSINNGEQKIFKDILQKEKNKPVNIFHLLGWEAGIVAARLLQKADTGTLKGWSYESPRGTQTFHSDTHYTYGPLYHASITESENQKCALTLHEQIPADSSLHLKLIKDRPEVSSDWKNNYLCI
ncbi:MAG: ABC transporter substrate-binding protein [Bacteroidia bacterium]